MACPSCGAAVVEGARFCAQCGARLPVFSGIPAGYGMPVLLPERRVQRHLQTLAVLWLIYGVYRLVAGLSAMFFVRAMFWHGWGGEFPFGPARMPFGMGMGGLIPMVLAFTLMAFGLALFTGWSLLNRKPWGRVLAIVAGILALLKFPLGMALGIFTLWVMAPRQSGLEYEALSEPYRV